LSSLEDAGLPGEVREALQGLVSQAGYDVEHQRELAMGVIAALSAVRVCDALRTYRAPRGDRVGRNDPCPCGSGKKHKKCCLRR
ncbi:MAG: SEC-C metal-binding domain-containing protein, partial [Desulfurivibrionaceae bacterium]|nr:SEC-C metal-binding domain-containing protein [Desulfurivibrionaceae bacterium]